MTKTNVPFNNDGLNLVNTGQIRLFVQLFGTAIDKPEYYGRVSLDDNFGQSRAESDIVELPSDSKRNQWDKVGEIVRAVERGETSFVQLVDQDLKAIWDYIHKNYINFNMYILVGDSSHPQDYNQWRSKYILENCHTTELMRGENANPQTSGDNANFTINVSANYWNVSAIGTTRLVNISGTGVTKNLLDVAIRRTDDERTSEIFAITEATAASDPSAIVYVKVNNVTNLTQTDITALGTDGEISDIAIVGSYLVGIQNDGSDISHVYSSLDDIRSGSDNFVQVTAGYTALKGPNSVYSLNSANTFLAADGGYVYKLDSVMSNPTIMTAGSITTENLNDISGSGLQVVAVGANSAIIYSNDLGNTWAIASAPTTGLTIKFVNVVDKDKWFIGTSTGVLYYTDDSGSTWITKGLGGGVSNLTDMKFYSSNNQSYHAFMIGDNSTDGLVYRTNDGGYSFGYTTPHVANASTVFDSVIPTALAVVDENEMVAVGGTTIAYGIN